MAQTKAMSYRTKIEFKVQDISERPSDSLVLVAVKDNSEQIVVMKFIPRSDYYNQGLEKNYKTLVDMEKVAYATAELLQMLYDTENLDGETYTHLIRAVKPCRTVARVYASLENFIKLGEGNVWSQ